jgi:hypothetical protein
LIDLQTAQESTIFIQSLPICESAKLYYFPETNLLCVKECSSYIKKQFPSSIKFTYIDVSEAKVIEETTINNENRSPFLQLADEVSRVNNHSMLMLPKRYDQTLIALDLRIDPQSTYIRSRAITLLYSNEIVW